MKCLAKVVCNKSKSSLSRSVDPACSRFDLFLVVQKVGFKNNENLIFIIFLVILMVFSRLMEVMTFIGYDLITRFVVSNETT